jgi:hypothetical protein
LSGVLLWEGWLSFDYSAMDYGHLAAGERVLKEIDGEARTIIEEGLPEQLHQK